MQVLEDNVLIAPSFKPGKLKLSMFGRQSAYNVNNFKTNGIKQVMINY